MKLRTALAIIASALLIASCGGGGGGGGSESGPGTNACNTLGLQTRIVNGSECSSQNSPVVPISLYGFDGGAYLCSGTVISPTYVLTAAHCFFSGIYSASVQINGRTIRATAYEVHPSVSSNETAVFNDVAIIRLASAAGVPSVPIVVSRQLESGDIISIFGYGQTESQSDSNNTLGTLRSGEMEIADVTSDHLIASYSGNGSNTCLGDSGGPALLSFEGGVGIVGMTSSGSREDCSAGDISLFANVQSKSILDFILEVVPQAPVI